MARLRFTIDMRYLREGQVYRIAQVLVDDNLCVENQSFGGTFIVAIAELYIAWGRGEIRFEVPTHIARSTPGIPLATEYRIADFEHLPAKTRAEAWRRYQLILPLLKESLTEHSRDDIIAYAEKIQTDTPQERHTRGALGEATSWASIERWLDDFIRGNFDLRALAPNSEGSGRKGKNRMNVEIETIMQAVLAECSAKPQYRTANDVYLTVINRIAQENRTRPVDIQLAAPSPPTIYRRIHTAGVKSILRRKHSRLEAQADKAVGEGPTASRVLERVQIDHTVLDIFLVDEQDRMPIGRPTLTFAIDVCSRMPFGLYVGFEPASYRTVASCLLHGILPKPDVQSLYETKNPWPVYGLPENMIIDNAKELINRDLDTACAQLGIILERMPVRTPWFKPQVERFFRTNNTGLIHTLPGTTFSNVLERGDYDAFNHSCFSLNAFWQVLHLFLLDVYAQNWHSGIKAIPAKRWHENIQSGFQPAIHTSFEETRILLMRTDTREVQRRGIEFENLFYRSPDLMRLRALLPKDGRSVQIKYDPADISTLYVSDPTERRWLPIPAVDQVYTHKLSLWKHNLITRFVRSEKGTVDIVALAEAKEKIWRIMNEQFAHTRKHRKIISRYLEIAVKPAPAQETQTLSLGSAALLINGPSEGVVRPSSIDEPDSQKPHGIDKPDPQKSHGITEGEAVPPKKPGGKRKDAPVRNDKPMSSGVDEPPSKQGPDQDTGKSAPSEKLHDNNKDVAVPSNERTASSPTQPLDELGADLDLNGWSVDYNLPS